MEPRGYTCPGEAEPLLSAASLSLLQEGQGPASSVESPVVLKQEMLDLLLIRCLVAQDQRHEKCLWGHVLSLGVPEGGGKGRGSQVYSPPSPLGLQLPLPHFWLFLVCPSLCCCWVTGFKITVVCEAVQVAQWKSGVCLT